MKLPIKLGKEPLVEATFEMRFTSRLPASNLLPGVLFGGLSGDKSLERLPVANLPEQIRVADVNLLYAPLIRVHWTNKFVLLIGDRSLGVGCKLPYPGWAEFKPSIIKVVELLQSTDIVEAVERCSIKATNVMPSSLGAPKDIVISELTISSHNIFDHNFQVRVEVKEDQLVHIVQIAAEGKAALPDGTNRVGMIIDIDTISDLDKMPKSSFATFLPNHLELLHDKNKQMFFSCLRKEALEKLEPQYG